MCIRDRVFTCGTSDFFIEEADEWRAEAWQMIRQRSEVSFFIITKRIHRFEACLPSDWGQGYPNVTIGCTCENQDRADYRLPIFLSLPIAHRVVICEPLLEAVDLSAYLGPGVEQVVAGGESGYDARILSLIHIFGAGKGIQRAEHLWQGADQGIGGGAGRAAGHDYLRGTDAGAGEEEFGEDRPEYKAASS